MSSTIIFHHTLPVDPDPKVGSTAHVVQMLRGFEAAGFEVEVVAGHSADRLRAMRRIRDDIAKGKTFAFAYGEASTAPTCLNDPDHLPRHPYADVGFFRSLRHAGVPIGLFYPDVHWRFPFYAAAVPAPKRIAASMFYRFDLLWYRAVLDILFLPSRRMRLSVPGWATAENVVGLAPGGVCDPLPPAPSDGGLDLFYVGSIAPPLYDIADLVAAVAAVPEVRLTISCPAGEAGIAKPWRSDRVTIVHEHGEALRRRYQECDVACLFYPPEPYREFAMPVKLFEAIGFGRPSIANPGTTAADFIASADVGWVVEPSALVSLLERLASDRAEVERMRDSVLARQSEHSWQRRAEFVAATLLSPPGQRPPSPTEAA